MFLWMVTAVATALAGCVFAARIAYRLVGLPGTTLCAVRAASRRVAGLLAIDGYSHLILIASSDPMIATLCLAAIDLHLSKRPRPAFAMLVLASLGRPEAWPFAVLYAGWAWRAVPSIRPLAGVGGLALIPAFSFTIPALTSKSWFISGDLALRTVNAVNVIHGSKLPPESWAGSSTLSLTGQIAALVGVPCPRGAPRSRHARGLAAAACMWIAVEFAMALHGWWGAASRYLIEPAAVGVGIAGSAVGRVLAFNPAAAPSCGRHRGRREGWSIGAGRGRADPDRASARAYGRGDVERGTRSGNPDRRLSRGHRRGRRVPAGSEPAASR